MTTFFRLALISLTFLPYFGLAQNLPKTILWKISGNGLEKPSWLFGTIHLDDKRLFNLGDSVYHAIETSDGFALEMHPDLFSDFVANEIKNRVMQTRTLKDYLSEKEFEKYKDKLSEKFDKPADEVTNFDVFAERSRRAKAQKKVSVMATFLDAYLCDIAKRQGKWIGGLEPLRNQTEMLDRLIDKVDIEEVVADEKEMENVGLNALKKMYLDNDLATIDFWYNRFSNGELDSVMLKRNRQMTFSIDSLSAQRTMFYAVGTAHLPGKIGLIEMLRQKGYKVEPVFSKEKIKPEKYKFREVDIPWQTLRDENDFYELQMPNKPGKLDFERVMEMNLYVDLFSGVSYVATAFIMPYEQPVVDSLKRQVVQRMFGVTKAKSGKKITVDGVEGVSISNEDEQGFKTGYLLQRGQVIYLVAAMVNEKNKRVEKDLKRFFNSYKILPFDPEKLENKPFTFSNEAYAFRIDIPAAPKLVDRSRETGEAGVKSTVYNVVDQKTGTYFWIGVNEASPGYFVESSTSAVEQIKSEVVSRFSKLDVDTAYAVGEWMMLDLEGGFSGGTGLQMKARYVFRGNRWYALVSIFKQFGDRSLVDRFYGSFELLDYPPSAWEKRTGPRGLYSTWAPGIFSQTSKVEEAESQNPTEWGAYDGSRSDTYAVISETFQKNYWMPDDSSLFEQVCANLTSYQDSILYKKRVINGSVRGLEFGLQEKGSFCIKRRRVLLYGDTLFSLFCNMPASRVWEPSVDRFFEDFRFEKPVPPSTLFESKAAELLQSLSSLDSAEYTDARFQLLSAPFVQKDLPLLRDALLKTYYFDTLWRQETASVIAEKIANLKDSGSVEWAKKLYPGVENPSVKSALLNIIVAEKTRENYRDMLRLLLANSPNIELNYIFLNHLREDPALTASALYPDFLQLTRDTLAAGSVIAVTDELLDSTRLDWNLVKPFRENLLQRGEFRLQKISLPEPQYDYTDFSLFDLLGRFNDAGANDLLKRWLTGPSYDYMRIKLLDLLLENHQEVPDSFFANFAGGKEYRHQLCSLLVEKKREDLFPKAYYNRIALAESIVYVYQMEAEFYGDSVAFLEHRDMEFQGAQKRFYFFKVIYLSSADVPEETAHLAVAGPYPAGSDAPAFVKNVSCNISFSDPFDPSKKEEQMKALLEDMAIWHKEE